MRNPLLGLIALLGMFFCISCGEVENNSPPELTLFVKSEIEPLQLKEMEYQINGQKAQYNPETKSVMFDCSGREPGDRVELRVVHDGVAYVLPHSIPITNRKINYHTVEIKESIFNDLAVTLIPISRERE
jgi:hypothetical protein